MTQVPFSTKLLHNSLPLSNKAIDQLIADAWEEAKRITAIDTEKPPEEWHKWIKAVFPAYVTAPFAPRHERLWEWVWAIQPNIRPRPYVAIWSRGGGKSSTAEAAAVAIGARGIRPYIWYVRETQDQADRSVVNIMDLLEESTIETYHPLMGERELGKYGRPRAWRREQIRTAAGVTIDAIGLDTARRGAKVKEHRPGLMIFDDLDGKHDSPKTTKKKIEIITTSLLPAGSPDLAVLMIQNLIIPNGIFSRLAGVSEESADFLADRIVDGPHPAVVDAEFEQRDGRFFITGGMPTWEGQNLDRCQEQIDTWGFTSWKEEAQHEVDVPPGGIWDHVEFRIVERRDVPDIVTGTVWVDPAVTTTDQSDSMGIQADGKASDGTIYRFYSWEQITTPEDALARAILKAMELGFETVGVETDQGGDTWRPAFNLVRGKLEDALRAILGTQSDDKEKRRAAEKQLGEMESWRNWLQPKLGQLENIVAAGNIDEEHLQMPVFRQAKAGSGHGSKVARNQRMLVDYEHGNVVHVRGTSNVLEKALRRFPLTPPLDLADAAYWSWHYLRKGGVFVG